MNLRTQMLLAGALTLAVPVIGWQSVKQLDASLRQTRMDDQSLRVANVRLALAEARDLQLRLDENMRERSLHDLYAETSDFPLFVDGYADDWRVLGAATRILQGDGDHDDARIALRTARYRQRLYLFLTVTDNRVVFHQPPLLRTDLGEGEQPDGQTLLVNGDAVELYLHPLAGDTGEHVLFRAIAPGPLPGLLAAGHGRRAGQEATAYEGHWIMHNNGYQLEISMPLPETGSQLAVAVVDVDSNGAARDHWLGTAAPEAMVNAVSDPDSAGFGRVYHTLAVADERLSAWVTPGTRARLFDRQGRLMADVNSLYDKTAEARELHPAQGGFLNAVLFRVFAYFVSEDDVLEQGIQLEDGLHLQPASVETLSRQQPRTQRYITADNDRVLGTLVPIGGDSPNGFLLFESNEDSATAYSASRVARLFSLLTLVSLLAGLVLLVYASILSMRIRSLSRLAGQAVSEDGRVRGLPGSDARDEIGDLSRNLTALLERSANYTQYLEALSSRLSHELRTPLSVVRTSIENMDREQLDSPSRTLLDRASGGINQLNSIIRALVESTRLEQTVQQAEMLAVPIDQWVQGALARYRQIYPEVQFSLDTGAARQQRRATDPGWLATAAGQQGDIEVQAMLAHIAGKTLHAAPELLQQALDKLVDNATGFSSDGRVVLRAIMRAGGEQPGTSAVTTAHKWLEISVWNRGSIIEADQLPQLFDPMYSKRNTDDEQLHLGLGLYIVRMIAEAHNGRAWADNRDDGVAVGMSLPFH